MKTPQTPKQEQTKPQSPASGSVRHDERGHAVWQWASDTARNAINSTSALLRKLEVPGLSLQDDPPPAAKSAAKRGAEEQGYSAFNGQRAEALRRQQAAGSRAGPKAAPKTSAKSAPKSAAPTANSPARAPARSSWWQRLLRRD